MRSIYEYSDYRELLKDHYDEQKTLHPGFSFRVLSQRAGVASSAFFKLVIEGKRNLTKQSVLKVATALKLDADQSEYFENLVFFNQAETVLEKNRFFDKLVQAQRKRPQAPILNHQYNYFAEWWHPVVRELVVMPGLAQGKGSLAAEPDVERIARLLRPAISAKQVQASLELLLRLGFLKRGAGGKLEQTEPTIGTGPSVNDIQVLNYQIQVLKLSLEAFDRMGPTERYHSSTTFGISKSNFDLFLGKIRAFKGQLQEFARADANPEQVVMLNIGFFPLSKSVKG